MSVFEQLGGAEGIRVFVDDLTARLAIDPALGGLFDQVDGPSLQLHREQYFAAVLGGPEHYAGRGLREAHSSLALDDAAYDRFLSIVGESLVGIGANPQAAADVHTLLERLRPVIVTPGSPE